MVIHVLPGDAQVEAFRETGIEGGIVVCRESLVEGPVNDVDLKEFWQKRAGFLSEGDAAEYFANVVPEFEKLINAPPGSEINLWFEYELFCQANMWFCLHLLADSKTRIYRVAPVLRTMRDRWEGFGGFGPVEMKACFDSRVEFSDEDIELGRSLWKAFQDNDGKRLLDLSEKPSPCFPYLKEVCIAAARKSSGPREILKEIVSSGASGIENIFPEFKKRAGVYGYGDLQVIRILNEL